MLGFLLLPAALATTAAHQAPASCGIANAERVTFDALLADPPPNQRCVAVRGLWSGHALYRNRHESRRQAGAPRIGVHASETIRARSFRPDFYTAVGNVVRCGDRTPDLGAPGGFCRGNAAGLYIAAGEMRRDLWPTPRLDR